MAGRKANGAVVLPDLLGSPAREARKEQLVRYLDPWGAPTVSWVHSFRLVHARKVTLNIYDLFPPTLNGGFLQ